MALRLLLMGLYPGAFGQVGTRAGRSLKLVQEQLAMEILSSASGRRAPQEGRMADFERMVNQALNAAAIPSVFERTQ